MITWGISAASHNAALAVFRDDQLIFASESERFSGIKNDPDLNKAFTKLKNDSNFEYFKSGFKRVISRSDSPGTEITWQFKNDFETECETIINFYYQLRSNITHRGKSGERKSKLLESSFNELLFLTEKLWDIKKHKSEETKKRIDNLIIKS